MRGLETDMRDGTTYRGTRANAAKHMKVKVEMPKLYNKNTKFFQLYVAPVRANRKRELTLAQYSAQTDK